MRMGKGGDVMKKGLPGGETPRYFRDYRTTPAVGIARGSKVPVWRTGTGYPEAGRFARVRKRPAHQAAFFTSMWYRPHGHKPKRSFTGLSLNASSRSAS